MARRTSSAEVSAPLDPPVLELVTDQFVPPETDQPLLNERFFETESHRKIRNRITRERETVGHIPQKVISTLVDLGEIAWKQTREKKVRAFSKREKAAIAEIHHDHFKSFERRMHAFHHAPTGPEYALAVMEHEGTAHPEHAIVMIPGWNGRYDSFAEQAKDPHLQKFSQIIYNRPGTDAESARIIREPGYTPADHMAMNVVVLEQILDRAVEHDGRERFTLVGHSMGGIAVQSFLDYAVHHRPDLYERINGNLLANTTPEDNVITGSFLDRIPGTPELLRPTIESLVATTERAMRLRNHLQRRFSESAIGGRVLSAAERLHLRKAQQREEEFTDKISEGLKVVMTVGYVDSMVGGDAKRDVYLASKGRAKQNDGRAMIYDGLAMLRVPKREHLAEVKIPTVVVSAGRDELLPDTGHLVAEQFVRADPENHRVREVSFDDSGHCTQMTDPEKFNELLHDLTAFPEETIDLLGTSTEWRSRVVKD